MPSSGMLRRVALVRTDISEELSASFIRVIRICELGRTLAVTSNRCTLPLTFWSLPQHEFPSHCSCMEERRVLRFSCRVRFIICHVGFYLESRGIAGCIFILIRLKRVGCHPDITTCCVPDTESFCQNLVKIAPTAWQLPGNVSHFASFLLERIFLLPFRPHHKVT
jgi:hypothetical protein